MILMNVYNYISRLLPCGVNIVVIEVIKRGNMKKNLFFFLLFVLTLCYFSSAFAAEEEPVIGCWMLDRVYESASGAGKYELDPENAQSVYADSENIYCFHEDGTASMWMLAEGNMMLRTGLQWRKNGDIFEFCEDDSFPMSLVYNEEGNHLSRFWKAIATDSMYNDLEFVYIRVPRGVLNIVRQFSH